MLNKTAFVFDGVPSTKYGLMIYYLDDSSTRDLSLGTNVDIVEDRLSKGFRSISYGANLNQSMSFPLTFGSTEYLDDAQVDEILTWLTGHQQYKWLELVDLQHECENDNPNIVQDESVETEDTEDTEETSEEPDYESQIIHAENPVRYRCHINDVSTQFLNGIPFAFTATVECDSQFGYELPSTTTQSVTSSALEFSLNNPSSYNGYIYPTLKITFGDVGAGNTAPKVFTLKNVTDNNREFKFDLSESESSLNDVVVNINNQHGIITNNKLGLNLYPYFNRKFFRLLRGENELVASVDAGSCTVEITCEFLRKVAGHSV